MKLERQQKGRTVASLTGHSKDLAFYFGWQREAVRGFWKREEILHFQNNHFGYSADNMVEDKENYRKDQLEGNGRCKKWPQALPNSWIHISLQSGFAAPLMSSLFLHPLGFGLSLSLL